jgi:hypothetical protein
MAGQPKAPIEFDLGVPFGVESDTNVRSLSGTSLEKPTSETPGIRGFEARVEGYMPKATQFAREAPVLSRVTPSYSSLPLVGPAFRSGYSAVESALGRGEGDTFGERYQSNVAWKEAMDRARRQEYPYSQIGTETAAGLAGAFISPSLQFGKLMQPVRDVSQRAAQYLAQRGLQKPAEIAAKVPGAVEKTATGAIYGTLGGLSEIKPGETPEEMTERATLGAIVGGAAPAVVAAGSKLASPVVRAAESFIDPKTAALRELYEKSAGAAGSTRYKERISPDEFIARQTTGQPVNVADIAGAPERLGAAAARFPDDPRVAQVNANLQDRINRSGAQIGNTIDSAFGRPVDAYALRQQAETAARQTNAPLYNAAYTHPNAQSISDPKIINVLNTNEGKMALAWADNEARKSVIGTNRNAPINPFTTDSNGNIVLQPGQSGASLEFLDWVKRGLNKVYGEQATNRDPARFSTQLMVDDFTTNLTNAVPGYGAALSNAGKFIRGSNAFEAGTEFVNLLPTSGRTVAPGELHAQLEKFNPVNRNAMSAGERDQFRLGLGAWVKENPSEASAIFKGNSPESIEARNAIRFVLGTPAFRQIDQSLATARTAAMLNEIKANLAESKKLSPVQTGALGALTGIGAYSGAPAIIQFVQQHPYMAGAAAAGAVGAKAVSMATNRRLMSLLDMAASNDPAVAFKAADTLGKIAAKNTRWEKNLEEIENTLGKFLAQSQMMDSNVPGVGPLNYEERKVGRATGGRVTAEGLVNAAERAKKDIGKTTETLLQQDDTSVAHALEIANRNLEG